ncbi:hypothetical protein C8Q73DRAFT_799537 [Cubamyces lactineus]|nr:hypothetical protein C8Q73DRAFT_799537 [Cubamyces lactineus]
MVSADNLNFDCLEIIFAYLSGNDLVSVSLVSRSFLAAAIPRIYRTLTFGLNQAKRYPTVISPFAAVLEHPNLASHVRHIDIRAIPTVKFAPQPQFLHDCARTISLCHNLGSFTCTLDVMPSFLLSLQRKESLEQLRFIGNLTTDQCTQLIQITSLRELTIDGGSWNIVDALPRWMNVLQPSLTSLSLYGIVSLNTDILETILPRLPHLTRLHILGCAKVDQGAILRLISHVPRLESLAFSTHENSRPLPVHVTALPRLRHLALDSQCPPTPQPTMPAFWTRMIDLTRTWSCPLKSLTLRLSDRVALGDGFVRDVVDAHHATLTHLALLNCALTKANVARVFRECTELERVVLSIPDKDVLAFSDMLVEARRLHTIIDVGDMHSVHPPHPPLSRKEVRLLMLQQPTIEKVIADNRVWTAIRYPDSSPNNFDIRVDKKKSPSTNHWFMPPISVL